MYYRTKNKAQNKNSIVHITEFGSNRILSFFPSQNFSIISIFTSFIQVHRFYEYHSAALVSDLYVCFIFNSPVFFLLKKYYYDQKWLEKNRKRIETIRIIYA